MDPRWMILVALRALSLRHVVVSRRVWVNENSFSRSREGLNILDHHVLGVRPDRYPTGLDRVSCHCFKQERLRCHRQQRHGEAKTEDWGRSHKESVANTPPIHQPGQREKEYR